MNPIQKELVRRDSDAADTVRAPHRPRDARSTPASLIRVVEAIGAGRREVARGMLAEVVRGLDDLPDDARVGASIFAGALWKRLADAPHAGINLYLQRFERPQIALFGLLAEVLPTVALAGPLANEVIARLVAGKDRVTLLDVGIGSGRQEAALLRLLAERGHLPARLDVIAIEPDGTSLARAGEALSVEAARAGAALKVHPVPKVVEALTDDDWAAFAAIDGPLVALGAFAAHHVRPGPARDGLFQRLHAIGAEAVVLCEPSSDHEVPALAERFAAALHHFGRTFDIIDGLDVADEDKSAMKLFFARELDDIVAAPEDARCERHAPAARWARRLRDAGFAPHAPPELATGRRGPVQVVAHADHFGLDAGGETLVAVLCGVRSAPG